MQIKVIKKDGTVVPFDGDKIKRAIEKTALRCGVELSDNTKETVVREVVSYLAVLPTETNMLRYVPVERIHEFVEIALNLNAPHIASEYKAFRNYKKELKNQFLEVVKETESIINDGDNENANRDSALIDAKKMMAGEQLSIKSMLKYELPKDSAQAHENLDIYIHDLRDRSFGSINCCLFDMGNVLKNGFTYNGVKYKEPNSIRTACALLMDIMNSARLQQYGRR